MEYQRSTLTNGLRIVTSAMPHARSVSVSVYVAAGGRYEGAEVAGISHFIEHLSFKGSAKRPTARAISEAIDGVGGVLNAATDHELTVYYAKVARPHFDLALDVLVDLLREPLLEPSEIEKERGVIIEELASIVDSPSQQVDVLSDQIMWPDQPLGRDVAGTPESVRAIPREAMLDYRGRQYVPNNVVVSVAGAIEHEPVVVAVAHVFGDWEPGVPGGWAPARWNGDGPRVGLISRRTEQAHVALSVPGLPLDHPDRQALAALSTALGEGMSSRLFQEVRERRGLAYDVHAYVSHFRDTGAFTVYAGVDPKRVDEALAAITAELDRVRSDGIDEQELRKVKELLKGRLMLAMEDTRAVSGWLGGQDLLLGRIRTVEEATDEVEAVTAAEVHRVATDLLRPQAYHLAVVGPYRSTARFERALRN